MMKWLELAFQSLLARWTRVDRILDSVHSTGTTSCRSSSSRLPPLLTPSVLFHRLQLRRWPRRQLPLQLRPTVAALEGHPSSCGPSSLAPSRSLCCFLPSSGSAASRVRDTGQKRSGTSTCLRRESGLVARVHPPRWQRCEDTTPTAKRRRTRGKLLRSLPMDGSYSRSMLKSTLMSLLQSRNPVSYARRIPTDRCVLALKDSTMVPDRLLMSVGEPSRTS